MKPNNYKKIKAMINDFYFEKFPALENDKLLLRKIDINDASDIFSIRTNDVVMKYMDSGKHQSIKDSEKFIADNLDSYDKKEGIFWAITDKSNGEFMGDFSFWKIMRDHHRIEIGYSLKPQFWGKGFMKETMQMAFDFGFKNLNAHSFEANINPLNESSKKALMRIGFKKEAYFRENYFFDGKYLDSEIYCLLEKDFK